MTISVSPVDGLFRVSVVVENQSAATRQHAQDEADRRRHERELAEALEAQAQAAAPSDPDSPPTAGTLLDVKA